MQHLSIEHKWWYLKLGRETTLLCLTPHGAPAPLTVGCLTALMLPIGYIIYRTLISIYPSIF